jgi:peptidoglycan/LPS O-acetylase OafA/YrhL
VSSKVFGASFQGACAEPDAQVRSWPFLDFLRSLAAFAVLIGHARNWFFAGITETANPSALLKLFYLVTVLHRDAVVVFFVISGFLIGASAWVKIKTNTFSWEKYLSARFSRIFLVYWPALILSIALGFFGRAFFSDPVSFQGAMRPLFEAAEAPLSTFDWICHVTGLPGFACRATMDNPALWSLGYEWTLYMAAPIVFAIILRSGNNTFRSFSLSVFLLTIIAMAVNKEEAALWMSVWFLGAFAGRMAVTRSLHPATAAIALILIFSGFGSAHLLGLPEYVSLPPLALGTALLVSCRKISTWSIAPRFFKWTASWSFSLYATHLPILFILIAAFQAATGPIEKPAAGLLAACQFAVAVAVCISFAIVFAFVTERHTNKIRLWIDRPQPENKLRFGLKRA